MPFYYDGACADHLRSLGFVNVIHRQEDFFERVLDLKFLRGIDLIWDNPPYTAPEMKERVLRALAQCGKPFVMLLPISVLHVGFVRDIIDMKRVQALIPRRVHVRKSGEEILPFKYLCWFCFGTKLPRDLIFVNDAKPEHEEPPLTTAAPKKRRKLRRKKGSAAGSGGAGEHVSTQAPEVLGLEKWALQRLPDVCWALNLPPSRMVGVTFRVDPLDPRLECVRAFASELATGDESHKSPEIVGALAALAEPAASAPMPRGHRGHRRGGAAGARAVFFDGVGGIKIPAERSSFTTNQQENDKKSGTACLESTEAALARFARGEANVKTWQGIQAVCGEQSIRSMVQALVDALLRPSCDAVAYDQLWSLRHIGKQSEVARAWIAEKGGLCAVAEAMARHPEHAKLQEEGAWIGYVLKGTGGFVELLKLTQAMPGNLPGTMAVQQATFRAIRELSEQQRERGKEGSAAWSEADLLVLGILTSMRSHSQPTSQFLCECFKVLNELIHDQAQRGMLFMQHGGGKALLEALSLPLEPFACLAGIWFMAVLVQGSRCREKGFELLPSDLVKKDSRPFIGPSGGHLIRPSSATELRIPGNSTAATELRNLGVPRDE
ncbi:unnamed protein product [Durusdinium trenchii]|uniref:Uncharacterized protein n=2 Tax=Durusdinium trenchii TaxID=1381693 RepID=A0ABP0HKV6_9DINO